MPEEAVVLEEGLEDVVAEEPSGEDIPEETPGIEDLATEMGWKPKENYQGDDADYVDAATYIRRSKDINDSMRQHLKENKRKMTSMEKGLEDLKAHNERVFKTQLTKQKREIEGLRKQRAEAIEEGDVSKVDKLEEEMSDLFNSTLATAKPQPDKDDQPDPEQYKTFVGWHQQNSWYGVKGVAKGNTELTDYANHLADLPEYGGMSYENKLAKVTSRVREMFPEQFKASRPKTAINPVEGPRMPRPKVKHTARDLTDDQRAIMRNFAKRGLMTEQEYINDLVKIGELT